MATEQPADDPQQPPESFAAEAAGSPGEPEKPAADPPDPPAPTEGSPGNLRRFDFQAPSFLTAAELRQLRLRHEEFVRSLTTRLSIYLRLEFAARVVELKTGSFRKFTEGLGHPTQLALFRVESLSGMGLVEVPPPLGMAMVDRLMGGPGQAANLEREFTQIEVEVLDLIVHILLKEWTQAVAGLAEAAPQIVSHETHPRFLQWGDPNMNLLQVTLEVGLNETTGVIQLAIPSAMLEPVMRQLNTGLTARKSETPPSAAAPLKWHAGLDDVPVPLQAAWKDLELTVRELAQLKVGDVLQVSPEQMHRVEVCVGRVPKFYGRLGTQDETWAVELTGTL